MIGMNGVVVIPEKVTMKAIQLVLISGKKCKLGGGPEEKTIKFTSFIYCH